MLLQLQRKIKLACSAWHLGIVHATAIGKAWRIITVTGEGAEVLKVDRKNEVREVRGEVRLRSDSHRYMHTRDSRIGISGCRLEQQ